MPNGLQCVFVIPIVWCTVLYCSYSLYCLWHWSCMWTSSVSVYSMQCGYTSWLVYISGYRCYGKMVRLLIFMSWITEYLLTCFIPYTVYHSLEIFHCWKIFSWAIISTKIFYSKFLTKNNNEVYLCNCDILGVAITGILSLILSTLI